MLYSIIRTILKIGGYTAPPPPIRKPFARIRTNEAAASPSREPVPVPARAYVRRLPTLGEACRRYREKALAWRLDDIADVELAEFREVMGPDLYSWIRVQALTGDRYTWRPGDVIGIEAAKRLVAQEMRTEVAIWERALAELDRLTRAARVTGKRIPAPLEVPRDIAALIEARKMAALERAKRRAQSRIKQGAVDEGSDGPKPTPPATPPPGGPRR